MKTARFLLSLLALLAIAHLSTAWIDGLEQMGVQAMIAAMPGLSQPWGEFFWNPHHPEHACNWEGINCATLDPFNPDLQSIISMYAWDISPPSTPFEEPFFESILTSQLNPFLPSCLLIVRSDLESKTGGFLPEEIGYFPNLTKLYETRFRISLVLHSPHPLLNVTNHTLALLTNIWFTYPMMCFWMCSTLFETGIEGTLPASLGTLENLESLVIAGSTVSGSLSDLRNMKKLKTLYAPHLNLNHLWLAPVKLFLNANSSLLLLMGFRTLKRTSISDKLPDYLASLPSLEEVVMTNNQLLGTIPASWSNWNSIKTLYAAIIFFLSSTEEFFFFCSFDFYFFFLPS